MTETQAVNPLRMTFNDFIGWWNDSQEHRIDAEREMFHKFVRDKTILDTMSLVAWCRYWDWFIQTEDFADLRDTQQCAQDVAVQ